MDMELEQSAPAAEVHLSHSQQEEVLLRVGHMTRTLHDSLRGLGFDKLIERAAQDIPDARDRLDYVARMTEQAAQRVLNATDIASPLQDGIAAGATELENKWKAVMASTSMKRDYTQAAEHTLAYLAATREHTAETKEQLLNIMMAQDFQDLTGQVIKKVTELAHGLEQQLVQLLIDFTPSNVKRETSNSLMNGPQINPEGSSDVVADQAQVDDLLDSLGF